MKTEMVPLIELVGTESQPAKDYWASAGKIMKKGLGEKDRFDILCSFKQAAVANNISMLRLKGMFVVDGFVFVIDGLKGDIAINFGTDWRYEVLIDDDESAFDDIGKAIKYLTKNQ